jgi:RNA recognition motif-containing protein
MTEIKDENLNQKLSMSLDDIIQEKTKDSGDEAKADGNESPRKNRGGDPEDRAAKIFVGNLSFKTSWQRLKDHMRDVGDVLRATIFEDRDGRSKGCGLVEFATREDALKAIEKLHESMLDGRQIYVREVRNCCWWWTNVYGAG